MQEAIEKYIRLLLFQHDRVTIPDLGSLVAEYSTAQIHPVHHTFSPANKEIRFDTTKKQGDGLLVNTLAFYENLSPEEARQEVEKYAAEVRKKLQTEGTHQIANVGLMTYQVDGTVKFEQDEAVNYNPDSFGLPELYFKPIEKARKKPNTSNQEKAQTTEKEKNRRIPAWAVSAAPVLLIALGVIGYFVFFYGAEPSHDEPPQVAQNKEKQQTTSGQSSENESSKQQAGVTALDSAADNPNQAASSLQENTDTAKAEEKETTQQKPQNKPTQPKPTPQPQSKEPSQTTSKPQQAENPAQALKDEDIPLLAPGEQPKRYYVVVGSFSNTRNAAELYDALQRKSYQKAKVLKPQEGKKLYKVSLGDYQDIESARTKRDQWQDRFEVVLWVLHY